jgi:hypothetical protein
LPIANFELCVTKIRSGYGPFPIADFGTYLSGRRRSWGCTRTKAAAKKVIADGLKSAWSNPDHRVTQFLVQLSSLCTDDCCHDQALKSLI